MRKALKTMKDKYRKDELEVSLRVEGVLMIPDWQSCVDWLEGWERSLVASLKMFGVEE